LTHVFFIINLIILFFVSDESTPEKAWILDHSQIYETYERQRPSPRRIPFALPAQSELGINYVETGQPIHVDFRKEEEEEGDFATELPSLPLMKEDKSVQVDVPDHSELAILRRENMVLKRALAENDPGKKKWEETFAWLMCSGDTFHFFTGFSLDQFDVLFSSLGNDVNNLVYWGSTTNADAVKRPKKVVPECQLIITLWRLRRGSYLREFGFHFGLDRGTIGKIFSTWIMFLFKKFSSLRDQMFVPRSCHSPLPSSFQNALLRNVRVVIDCTEIFTESAENYKQQGNLYSQYKSHSTAKFLIGVAPSGACMFVSDAFEGCISDKEIVKQSGFLDKLEKGDAVLADRGFTIFDECAGKEATLIIPPFLTTDQKTKEKKLSREETVQTKIIARARIHVERFNERLKNFEILAKPVPIALFPLLSQIVFVLCCFVNFDEPLNKTKTK
jgi:hypothetical protein